MVNSWYILHTYTGYEAKIERAIKHLVDSGELSSEVVLETKIPTETVTEVKDGKRRDSVRKFLPGYIMIRMDLPEIGWKAVCSSIRRIQGVSGFVGVAPNARPRPLSTEEATSLLEKCGDIKGERSVHRLKQSFSVGEQVKIVEGSFAEFSGTIEDVNLEKGKLRVMVNIFGRDTPVELGLLQVEKI